MKKTKWGKGIWIPTVQNATTNGNCLHIVMSPYSYSLLCAWSAITKGIKRQRIHQGEWPLRTNNTCCTSFQIHLQNPYSVPQFVLAASNNTALTFIKQPNLCATESIFSHQASTAQFTSWNAVWSTEIRRAHVARITGSIKSISKFSWHFKKHTRYHIDAIQQALLWVCNRHANHSLGHQLVDWCDSPNCCIFRNF